MSAAFGYAGMAVCAFSILYVILWVVVLPFTREDSFIQTLFPEEEILYKICKWIFFSVTTGYVYDVCARLRED